MDEFIDSILFAFNGDVSSGLLLVRDSVIENLCVLPFAINWDAAKNKAAITINFFISMFFDTSKGKERAKK